MTVSETPSREMYTSTEMAAILGVTEETVRRMLRRGELPGRRLGGIWLCHRPRFHRWIETEFGGTQT